MRTEELIADLAARATPVRRLPSPAVRAGLWVAIAGASAAAGIAIFGLRPEVGALVGQPEFAWTALFALVTSVLGAAAALVLAIPGARAHALRGVAFTFLAAWALVMVTAVVRAGHGLSGVADWPICFIRVVSIALVPGAALYMMIRRAAPLRLPATAAMAMLGAAAVGAGAIQFICPIPDAGHALAGHFAPVIAAGVAGAAWGRRLFSPRVRTGR